MKPLLSDAEIQQLADQHGSPLLVVDCEQLQKQYKSLQQALPDVEFFYALKAFPNDAVINTLKELGSGFDLASLGEIEQVRQHRVNPRTTIHSSN